MNASGDNMSGDGVVGMDALGKGPVAATGASLGRDADSGPKDETAANARASRPDADGRALQSEVRRAAVFFVGNRLMLDEGIGPAVFDEMQKLYDIPDNVLLFDVGCMSLDMLPYVEKCDFILTVDAVDGTGQPAGTVFRYPPEDMARHCGALRSLHDLALVDLFDAASLLGYEAEGFCVGMQVQNMEPSEYVMGLTPPCYEALPLLIETVEAELYRHGFPLRKRSKS